MSREKNEFTADEPADEGRFNRAKESGAPPSPWAWLIPTAKTISSVVGVAANERERAWVGSRPGRVSG